MKYTILIALLLAASCTHHQPCNDTNQACAPGAGGITGVIVADAATPHSDVISGCRSPHFDAEETEARADQAFSDLQYDDAFGGYDGFKKEFAEAGATQFGSGWAWLIVKNGKLEVRKTLNAETPLTEAGATPLLTMDVWEHAYYLDYQNKRPDYISAFLDNLVNWDFVSDNLSKA